METKTGMKKNTRRNPEAEDSKLDQALDESFPASDPPAMTEPTKHVGSKTPARMEDDDGPPSDKPPPK